MYKLLKLTMRSMHTIFTIHIFLNLNDNNIKNNLIMKSENFTGS